MRFFTSDTHFGHQNILKYSNRPFASVEDMNDYIVAHWNVMVGPNDEVFHLGDVALGPWVEWDAILTRLNGFKTLVVGNHDRVFKGMSQKQNDKFAEHYDRWFDVVTDEIKHFRLNDGTFVNMSHFPYDGDHTDEERYREFRLDDNGTPLIHGHTHLETVFSYSKEGTPQVHVGMDAWNYRLVNEAEVVGILQRERESRV